MKLTFEGKTFSDILDQMADTLKINLKSVSESADMTGIPPAAPGAKAEGPGPTGPDYPRGFPSGVFADPPTLVKTSGENPVEKPFAKKMREAREAARAAKKDDPKPPKAAKKAAPVEKPEDEPAPPPKTAEGMDPAEVVKLRQKTIEDLQSAYANGHQKEVFELLSRFGNGAKSFRELPADAFVPIREAIDNGALT